VLFANNLSSFHEKRYGFCSKSTKTNRQCHQRWDRVLKRRLLQQKPNGRPPGADAPKVWTAEEDAELLALVEAQLAKPDDEPICWKTIAEKMSSPDVNYFTAELRYTRLMAGKDKNVDTAPPS
jgi:hypothetical protein